MALPSCYSPGLANYGFSQNAPIYLAIKSILYGNVYYSLFHIGHIQDFFQVKQVFLPGRKARSGTIYAYISEMEVFFHFTTRRIVEMRKHLLWLSVLAFLTVASGTWAVSITPTLVADTAPNAYGSPNWGPWWTQAKADVAAGTFINMRSGAHPGTTYFEPQEEIVYSTMDLGKRLHWIYWVPGKTIRRPEAVQLPGQLDGGLGRCQLCV